MEFYHKSAAECCAALGSGPQGLSGREAAARLTRWGKNELKREKPPGLFARFLRQMADPMIVVLLAAAALSALTAACAGESFADVFIILAVVAVNGALGVFQEAKAEKAIEALQAMTAARSRVVRDGSVRRVESSELVPGDLVLLEAGCAVPADGRLVEAASLKIEESALTGESVPAEKTAAPLPAGAVPLAERACMAYMGGGVVYGRGRLLVTATGMDTEMGRIAGALAATAQGKTPLQQKLAALSRTLSGVVLAICAFLFGFGLWRGGGVGLADVLSAFMVAVSLAVAAIPEGLAAVVTVLLSMGVTRMSRRGAVVRRLTAVETLGCAQVICTDKTGTLTRNRMEVRRHFGPEAELAQALALCSDAVLTGPDTAEGEPTERALVEYAARLGRRKPALEAAAPRVAELPFDPKRKCMSTFHVRRGGGVVQYTKGAPDLLLARCTHWLRDGAERPLTPADRAAILAENHKMAAGALRVLAAARRDWPALPANPSSESCEQGLVFLGLAGMEDPPRPQAGPAIARCKAAGIRPVMITGDHRDTAAAVARQLGLLQRDSQAVTGGELDRLSDAELARRVGEWTVFARVQPHHKVRIVRAFQARGLVTAMTGDGVNDAPALKAADIGVGMGRGGAEVTRAVADMVLTDDDFSTIVAAVAEGRRIYANIRKAVQFLLASNAAEVLSIFLATLAGVTLLKPVHLLWLNLITDCFPALALGMEKAEPDQMTRPPRRRGEGLFARGLGPDVLWQGALLTALTLSAYALGARWQTGAWQLCQSEAGVSMAFLTMSMAEIFHSFDLRSRRGSVFALQGSNPWLWAAMAGSLALSLGVLLWPAAAELLGFWPLPAPLAAVALGLAAAVVPAVEAGKGLLAFWGRRKGAKKPRLAEKAGRM